MDDYLVVSTIFTTTVDGNNKVRPLLSLLAAAPQRTAGIDCTLKIQTEASKTVLACSCV